MKIRKRIRCRLNSTCYKKLKEALENELPLSSVELNDEEKEVMATYQFLTTKPLLICINVAEDDLVSPNYKDREEVMSLAEATGLQVIEVSVAIEKEIAELDEEEKKVFMKDLGIEESGIVRISRSMYKRSWLNIFFYCWRAGS